MEDPCEGQSHSPSKEQAQAWRNDENSVLETLTSLWFIQTDIQKDLLEIWLRVINTEIAVSPRNSESMCRNERQQNPGMKSII